MCYFGRKRERDTYLLTHSMVQFPFSEANWFAASQEIPRISRNLKVHYRTHKRPPPVSILGQRNPVHVPTSHVLEIHPNIIHPSTPRSPQWFPSFRFLHQDPIHPLEKGTINKNNCISSCVCAVLFIALQLDCIGKVTDKTLILCT